MSGGVALVVLAMLSVALVRGGVCQRWGGGAGGGAGEAASGDGEEGTFLYVYRVFI